MIYVPIGGQAKKVIEIYRSVDGVAKQVTKGYIGINNQAKRTYNRDGFPQQAAVIIVESKLTSDSYSDELSIIPRNVARIISYYTVVQASIARPQDSYLWVCINPYVQLQYRNASNQWIYLTTMPDVHFSDNNDGVYSKCYSTAETPQTVNLPANANALRLYTTDRANVGGNTGATMLRTTFTGAINRTGTVS